MKGKQGKTKLKNKVGLFSLPGYLLSRNLEENVFEVSILLFITSETGDHPERHRGRRFPTMAATPQHLERGREPWHPGVALSREKCPSSGTVQLASFRRPCWWGGVTAQNGWSLSPGCTAYLGHHHHRACPYPNACQHDPKSITLFFFFFEKAD